MVYASFHTFGTNPCRFDVVPDFLAKVWRVSVLPVVLIDMRMRVMEVVHKVVLLSMFESYQLTELLQLLHVLVGLTRIGVLSFTFTTIAC